MPNFNEKKHKNGVFVILEFEKPLLLRGFGLRSASDNSSRDPKDFVLYVENFLKTDEKAKEVRWKMYHEVNHCKWRGKDDGR